MIERLKICWLVLTKKKYAFYGYDKDVKGKTNAVCFIKDGVSNEFLAAIIDYTECLRQEVELKLV